MQPQLRPEGEPPVSALIELPAHSRLPRLDLGVEWESPWDEFRSSFHASLKGPRPARESEAGKNSVLRIEWVRGKSFAGGLRGFHFMACGDRFNPAASDLGISTEREAESCARAHRADLVRTHA